jgi:hypothetical protein
MSAPRIIKFVDLPTDITLHVISNFMLPEDLGVFDSSLCNLEQRKHFLALIRSKPFSIIGNYKNCPYYNCKFREFQEWINFRQIKVRSLYLSGSFQMYYGFLLHNFEEVRKLELIYVPGFADCASEISSIINKCKLLDELVVYDILCFNVVFDKIHINILTDIQKLKIYHALTVGHLISLKTAWKVAEYCSRLVYLHIHDDCYVKIIPGFLGQLVRLLEANSNLLCIILGHASLDDSILIAIRTTCKKVQQVSLSLSPKVTLGAMIDFRDSCIALTSFHVKYGYVQRAPKYLDVLNNFATVKLGDVWLVKVSTDLSLSTVSLSRITEVSIIKLTFKRVVISSSIMYSIARNSPLLELLCVDDCGDLFSLHSMLEIALKCLHLSHLHLGLCGQFTPHDLVIIFSTCFVSLRVVSIAHNAYITSREVLRIVNECNKVEEVCLHCCESISHNLVRKYFCCDYDCNCKRPTFHQSFDKNMFNDFCGKYAPLF